MSNMKVVSIVDHEMRRSRAALLDDMANLATQISIELMAIDYRLRKLRADLDTMMVRPAIHPQLAQDERSKVVEQGGVDPA